MGLKINERIGYCDAIDREEVYLLVSINTSDIGHQGLLMCSQGQIVHIKFSCL